MFSIIKSENRIFGLDLIRFLAIFLVLLQHSLLIFPDLFVTYNHIFFYFDGVSFFFVLSGFLIGNIFISQTITKLDLYKSFLNFWIRRWFRTLPNYFTILFLLLGIDLVFFDISYINQFYKYCFFIQNLFREHPFFFLEAWSLSVEEWFYIILPIIFLFAKIFFKNSNKRAVLITVIFFIMISFSYRIYRFCTLDLNYSIWGMVFRAQVLARFDSIAIGVLGSFLFKYYKDLFFKHKKTLFIIGLTLLILQFFFAIKNDFYFYVMFSAISAIGILLLFPIIISLKYKKGGIRNIITYTSLISYSLYMSHYALVQQRILINLKVSNSIIVNNSIKYILFWILSFAISTFLFRFIETPFMKLRDKYYN